MKQQRSSKTNAPALNVSVADVQTFTDADSRLARELAESGLDAITTAEFLAQMQDDLLSML